jgi:FtsP/CotA-like multicopper oxidase with cupredoxin domain
MTRACRVLAIAATALLASAARPAAVPLACPEPTALPAEGDPLTYCMLLEPAPGSDASGIAWLQPFAGAFGVAVDRDGRYRHHLAVTLADLPAPATLGATHYVAWATTPTLAPMRRLGVVRNGTTTLGPVSFERFLLVVSAERDSTPDTWTRLVLRGFSPNGALMPHGSSALPARRPATAPHASHAVHADSTRWPHPLMHPRVPTMVPGLESLAPPVTPQHGAGRAGAEVPDARAPRRLALEPAAAVTLRAAPTRRTTDGVTWTGFAFDGSRIGPLLTAHEGDSAIVTVENALGEATAVHWHGLRHDWRSDGAAGLSQPPDPSGSRRDYALRFRDPGLFWYHAHVREDRQQDLGLAGLIKVAPRDSAWLPPVASEALLLLDDILVGADGLFPHGRETATHALMGRIGNRLLLNGEHRPTIRVPVGEPVRLWFANAANARIFNVSVDAARLKLVAGDMGRLARDLWTESVVIAPGERWAADVLLDTAGRVPLMNRVIALDGWAGAYFAEVDTIGWLEAEPTPPVPGRATRRAQFARLATRPAERAAFGDLDAWRARAPDRTLRLTLALDSLPFGLVQAMRLDTAYVHPLEWTSTMPMMDVLATADRVHWELREDATGRVNHALDWSVPQGTRLKVRLHNDRHTLHPMPHPIHLHGQRFVVLARNGVPNDAPVWKDTVIVPAGATVDLLVEFATPGRWMLHCHNAEHLVSGMHATVTVTPS